MQSGQYLERENYYFNPKQERLKHNVHKRMLSEQHGVMHQSASLVPVCIKPCIISMPVKCGKHLTYLS